MNLNQIFIILLFSLIVDLVIKSSSMPKIFAEVVELASALLEGGNQDIQKGFFNQLDSTEVSQTFFKVSKKKMPVYQMIHNMTFLSLSSPQVFYDKVNDAQTEIKSTVTVNTTDIAARSHEDKDPGKDLEKAVRKRGRKCSNKTVIPAEHSTILEPQNLPIDELYDVQKRQSVDFAAVKL